jgi:hypothetical protein
MKGENQNSDARIESSIAGQRHRKEISVTTNKHTTIDDAVLLMWPLLGNGRYIRTMTERIQLQIKASGHEPQEA